jgi:hypothetical protein
MDGQVHELNMPLAKATSGTIRLRLLVVAPAWDTLTQRMVRANPNTNPKENPHGNLEGNPPKKLKSRTDPREKLKSRTTPKKISKTNVEKTFKKLQNNLKNLQNNSIKTTKP